MTLTVMGTTVLSLLRVMETFAHQQYFGEEEPHMIE